MGGKTKQSQRTKNNVRPSSSGRSAEALGNIDLSLLKLTVGNGQSTIFPTVTSINLEQGLSPEFHICVKKLNKKDPITKTKALQELCELVNTNKVEDVVTVLPSWAYFYKILTVDTDRKVRESTQACHSALASVCGRQVAPHLKQLLPAWLQALHDDHAPAQTFAVHSLKKTFPERKLPEVLSFSKAEIMSHLLESLTGNGDSILIRKTESAEEKEFQENRLVSSSLQALDYFILHLPAAHGDWLWTQLAPLLQNNLFWKFHSYNVHQIRAAWYATTGRMIERFKSTFGEKYGTKTMRILLGAGKETNSAVAANLWACLLQLMHSAPNWHKYLEKKELLIKRILDVLENGGWGDARHLSNLLLPLLAHLPPDVFHKEFYQSFFDAIFAGLKQKNIWSSKSERQSWITSLVECLKYLSIQEYDFVTEIVTSVHRTWLQEVLAAQHDSNTTSNLVRCSAANMASLIKYWLKQSKESNSEKHEQLIRNFWQNIGSTISARVDNMSTSHEEITQLMEQHILLFKTLKTSLQDSKKQQSIKFELDSEVIEEKCLEQIEKCDVFVCERYKHNLDELVYNMCFKYFEFAHDNRVCECIITPLLGLLTEFDDEKLFLCVAKQFNADTLYQFYDNILREWLIDEKMRCKALVDVVFLLLRHMNEEEQKCTMDSFQQCAGEVCEWAAAAAAAGAGAGAGGAVRGWARGGAARGAVGRVARRALQSGAGMRGDLLPLCLARDINGEMLFGAEAACDVLRLLCAALRELGADAFPQRCRLAAPLAAALRPRAAAAAELHARWRDLLLQLFLLNYHVPRDDGRLSPETWREVHGSWREGVSSLDPRHKLDFLLDLARIIQGLLFDNMEGLSANKIENITSLCPYLLSKDSTPPADLQLTSTFTQKLFEHRVDSLETFALHHDCIFGNLNCPFEDYEPLKAILDDPCRELSKPDVEKYLNSLLFRCMYLNMVLLHKDEVEDEVLWCEMLLADEHILMEFCKVMYDYAIVCSLCEGYVFWEHYQVLGECKGKLEVLLTEIISESSPASRSLVLKKLSELAASSGYYWSYARRYFQLLGRYDSDEEDTLDLTTLADAVTGNGLFHSLQAKCKSSPDEEALHRCKFAVMLRSFLLAYGEQLQPPELRELAAARDLSALVTAYFRHPRTMLYETDISDAPWSRVVSNAAVLDFLTHYVQHCGWEAPAHCWDFITITLCSLLCSLEKSKHNWDSLRVGLLSRAVLRLFVSVSEFVQAVPGESTRRMPTQHVAHLPTEWKDIFAPDLHANLFSLFLHVLNGPAGALSCSRAALLEGLARGARGGALPGGGGTSALRGVARATAACLGRRAHPAYAALASAVFELLADALLREDARRLAEWSERAEELEEQRRPALALDALDAALRGAGAGAGGAWRARAAAARALHALCERAEGDVLQQLLAACRERGYVEALLSDALQRLPARLYHHALENTSPPPPHYESYFTESPDDSLYNADAELEARLACRCVWWAAALGGGAGARAWAGSAGGREARVLAYAVRAYVAPRLVRRQLAHLQRHADRLDDAEVKIRWSSNEVFCSFLVEERRVEVRVCFARDHPLAPPRVSVPSALELAPSTNRIVFHITYQDGMVADALRAWRQALSSRVESAPQCYICYCRLEASSGRVPRLRCRQCSNKFHHSCVRKWFSTSKKSTCPLCRAQL